MNDVYQQLVSYAASVWRKRWYIVALSWLVSGAGWTMVSNLPDQYQSNARIYVDMDTMLGPLMRGLAVEMNLFQQIDIMQRTLLSRPNLEKVVLMTDLDLKIDNEEEKEELLTKLRSKIKVRQQGRNLFNVAYEDTDPNLTKRIVQAVLQIFVEGNLGASRKDMDATRRFLDGQIREYERQLEAAEARLADFKRKNMGFLPGEGNYYSHLQKVRGALAQTQGQIAEGEMVRDELREQLASVPQFLELESDNIPLALASQGPISGGPESDTQLQILEMEKLIDALLARYTENHPDVVTARKRVETLQKQLAEEQNQEGPAGEADPLAQQTADLLQQGGKNVVPNPIYEKIKLQLVQQEAAIAALKRRGKDAAGAVEKWEKMAQLVPNVEAELQKLNRDYGIVKRGYEQLRQRQESARLARDLETKAQKIQFRVIDPPKVPIKPSGPNRPLFMSVVLLAGLGAGVAFAFLLSQISTTFPSAQRLRATFALPVVGSVTAIMSSFERRRRLRELVSFGTVLAALFGAYGMLLIVEMAGGDLVVQIKDAVGQFV